MRARAEFLDGLLELHRYEDRSARRSVFRQSIASLAIEASLDGPPPLDGLSAEALLAGIRVALADGLFDDLGWLAPAAAAVALYEITGALPLGPERREIGRRVLAQLYDGSAATFVALATRMALGSARALAGAPVRARIALALQLPGSVDVPVDPLALALVSRRDLARDWVGTASTGSLPERRLAARLLERAAREAVRRASQGDDDALRLFRGLNADAPASSSRATAPDVVLEAYHLLLADRETLVWRHVAAARGLLSGALPELEREIRKHLAPNLTPTEWRRAATSLVASIAVDPENNLATSRDLLASGLLREDPGLAIAMVWGLPRAADAEPEAAEALLETITAAHPIAVADSVADLRLELGPAFGMRARAACVQALAVSLAAPQTDDGLTALGQSILRDLEGREPSELGATVRSAVDAFVEGGSREAHARSLAALDLAASTLDALDALDAGASPTPSTRGGLPVKPSALPPGLPQTNLSRRAAARLVRELDSNLYESGALRSLLLLERRGSGTDGAAQGLDTLDDRITRWLLRVEAQSPPEGTPPHATFHQRNLRALLHVVDGESTDGDSDGDAARGRGKRRLLDTCDVLSKRLTAEPGSPLRRAVVATVARAFDALVRTHAADAADVLLFACMRSGDPETLAILAEASVHPDVRKLLACHSRFTDAINAATAERGAEERMDAALAALEALVAELPQGTSQRTEALRTALARLARGLDAVRAARALAPLAESATKEGSPLVSLEDALVALARLTASARRRFGDGESDEAPHSTLLGAHALALAAGMAREGGATPELQGAIEKLVEAARASVPAPIAVLASLVLPRLCALPGQRAGGAASEPDDLPTTDLPLPAWLPPRRTIGGYFVHRRLGGGAVGTVFVVTRAEERHDPHAERFALKVPDYDATAARSVSEAEFLKLFRDEAGALLSLPDHANLPRFVTFDAGARPKPILVMELIEGVRGDQLIDSRSLTIQTALALLDGVLAGLEAMHSVRIGHLDVKPSNIILRGGKGPVLVDFGLAGRHIRPGCATANYGAPEVWDVVPEGATATPLTADIYSFGCLAYEALTGDTLFDGPSDVALISAHLTHDGLPPKIRRLSQGRLASVGMFLFQCLRHNPEQRMTATSLRAELRRIAPEILRLRWPIAD
ncbi:serine/threonine-protein kinase [Polyangium fumosum]|uniref:Serine/threonine protein kinase n=1 Tax=Polyangium fumosum TaxID=889272 RepID=A0A4U1JBH8_9BACT|nr:serine/threonine-protein kinase [Polyangium fumosum]TKD05274.1 serine/threonine protein kinase [Polyangium fumosum]